MIPQIKRVFEIYRELLYYDPNSTLYIYTLQSEKFIVFELYRYLKAFDIELQNRQKHFRRCFDAGAYRLRNY